MSHYMTLFITQLHFILYNWRWMMFQPKHVWLNNMNFKNIVWFIKAIYYYYYCYSFKIFPHFWLVKSTRKIHLKPAVVVHFGQNFVSLNQWRQIAAAADYWTDDVKMTSKVQPVDRENLGTRLCYFWWAEKQKAKWRNSFKDGEIFWMKQLLNSAFVGYGEFCRSRRVLSTSAFSLCG